MADRVFPHRLRPDPLAQLAGAAPGGIHLINALSGPFRRAVRRHPRRGTPTGWGSVDPVPWNDDGFWHAADLDPGASLDYHTGCIYPQDAASQLPVRMLAPQPGETIIDVCAAPGSKSSQIGIALGDDGLLICCDASAPRRRVLVENLARQGVSCAVVTPMPVAVLAIKHPGCADAVLVDAPCSGHEARSAKQVRRMSEIQGRLLDQAAMLVRANGRLVYSTCTPYREENEDVVIAFLTRHLDWVVEPRSEFGCDADLAGLGAVRLWPQRQGTEPFFACVLRAPARNVTEPSLVGDEPSADNLLRRWLPTSPLLCWSRGTYVLAATAAAAACALPSEARGLVMSRDGGHHLDAWGAQALIERGSPTIAIDHADACAAWEGVRTLDFPDEVLLATTAGAPIGIVRGKRLDLPSRLRRANLR